MLELSHAIEIGPNINKRWGNTYVKKGGDKG